MGALKDGKWLKDVSLAREGAFEREPSQHRNSIGEDGFPPDQARYVLYVAWACPWAHRTLLMRALKGLTDIEVCVVAPLMADNGWTFENHEDQRDPYTGSRFLYEIYLKHDSDATTRVTVPLLWDQKKHQIVNNESSEIIRMFNSAFEEDRDQDFYPEALRKDINGWNDDIYSNLNNGVYRAGFAGDQSAYDAAVADVFDCLNRLDSHLATNRYLIGSTLTEADLRLLPTLLRFDAVYAVHFKCTRKRLLDYPVLYSYARDLYQMPGVAETFRLQPVMEHYYGSHRGLNPLGIVPLQPCVDFGAPQHRVALSDTADDAAVAGVAIAPTDGGEDIQQV